MAYKISNAERELLYGLPHIQQLLYFVAIRPYMDYATGIVGIKRKISHRSLQEELYVQPHQGRKAFMPSRDQIRRSLNALEKVGLIELRSTDRQLILKCLLADKDFSVLEKAAIGSPSNLHTAINENVSVISDSLLNKKSNSATVINSKAAIHPESGISNQHTQANNMKISSEFFPSPDTIDKAKLARFENVLCPVELAKFIAFHQSRGTVRCNWDAEFLYWVFNTKKFQQGVKKHESNKTTKKTMSAIDRVANANRKYFENPQAKHDNATRYCLVMAKDD